MVWEMQKNGKHNLERGEDWQEMMLANYEDLLKIG